MARKILDLLEEEEKRAAKVASPSTNVAQAFRPDEFRQT